MDSQETNYSSLSELDNLSDSDWLDIPSSRASEDTDSVLTFDSDHEDSHDRPSSRRSFTSIPSSRGEAIAAWEGLIEDSAEESDPFSGNQVTDEPLAMITSSGDEAVDEPGPVEDEVEEQRVKAALDQSMMSTLSSSRSNSLANSLQTSVVRHRDLRLSFPDPITSSLNNSYEEISPPIPDEQPSNELKDDIIVSSVSDLVADPSSLITPEVPQEKTLGRKLSEVPSAITPDFYVVLYGLPSLSAKSPADSILEKWATSNNLVLSCKVAHDATVQTHVYVSEEFEDDRKVVSIIDKRGENDSSDSLNGSSFPNCPSLAIVTLPSLSNIVLYDHTLFLPIVAPNLLAAIDVFASTDYLLDAEYQWKSQGVESDKLTSLSSWTAPVIDQDELEQLSPAHVQHALKPLFASCKKTTKNPLSPGAILLAILSIVLGYVVNGSMPYSGVGSSSSPALWKMLRPQSNYINQTLSHTPFASGSSGLSPSLSETFGLAVFQPITSSLSVIPITSQSLAPVASTSGTPRPSVVAPTECSCGCGLVTLPSKLQRTDLMVRSTPSTSLSSYSQHAPASPHTQAPIEGNGKGKGKALDDDTSIYALSTRIAGSLSEYFDFDFTVMMKAAATEIQDVLDALDSLAHAISRQTSSLLDHSITAVSTFRQTLQQRNSHAKERARMLRHLGGQFLSSVGKCIMARTEAARDNAKILRERIGRRDPKEMLRTRRGEALRVKRMKKPTSIGHLPVIL